MEVLFQPQEQQGARGFYVLFDTGNFRFHETTTAIYAAVLSEFGPTPQLGGAAKQQSRQSRHGQEAKGASQKLL